MITSLRSIVAAGALCGVLGGVAAAAQSAAAPRPRARDLGLSPGVLEPGPRNAITDVPGVLVGHATLVEGSRIRTGVTAVLPHGGNIFQSKVRAGVYAANAFGKAAGLLQVQELGELETPIVLTNTLSVGAAVAALVAWTLEQPGNEGVRSVNAVVGETNDGFLNDIRAQRVDAATVRRAIASASAAVEEGAVGAGAGTVAFGWKGGIGTASRRLPRELGGYLVGALVQANFGGVLTMDGVRVGEALRRYSFRRELEGAEDQGSAMIVLATDAPIGSRNLSRLARRGVLGLARTGSFMSNGSGDFVIAFSTANRRAHRAERPTEPAELLRNEATSPLFLAAVEAVEESVYNALLQAETVAGHRGTVEALPIERLRELLARRDAVDQPPGPP